MVSQIIESRQEAVCQGAGTNSFGHPNGYESSSKAHWSVYLRRLAQAHACWHHPLFQRLEQIRLSPRHSGNFLANYDAHASVLRRLLLKAATLMPDEAVTYVLENVSNEYGNGNPGKRHQLQLLDLAHTSGANTQMLRDAQILPQIKTYISLVTPLYYPNKQKQFSAKLRPAIAGGAIAATEILAVKEFESLQKAYDKLGLANHIWFDHVTIEQEHTDESLELALHFIEKYNAMEQVEFGMKGVLDANVILYDGLLATLE